MRLFAYILLMIFLIAMALMVFGNTAKAQQSFTFKAIGKVPYFPRNDTIRSKLLVTLDCNVCLKGAQSMTGYQVVRYNYDPTWVILPNLESVEIFYLSNNKELLPKWVTVWMCKEIKE